MLLGRSAIVTGGSRGIGLAIGRALAQEGAAVALVGRNAEALQRASETVQSACPAASLLTVHADTTQDDDVARMVARVAEQHGSASILVNGAADSAGRLAVEGAAVAEVDVLRAQLETKVLGYLRCARAVAPAMVRDGWGRIINIGGLNARETSTVAGSIRNVAVAALTKNLADELGPYGVNVTVVHPGSTGTDSTATAVRARASASGRSEDELLAEMAGRTSIGRIVTPAEVAAVVAFLASPLSVAINGDAIAVGGGRRGAIHY